MSAELDQEGFSEIAFAQQNQRPGDDHLLVRFYMRPKQNEAKSTEAGRPIFEETEYINILTPGNKDNIIDRPVSDIERRRFARAYAAFKAEAEQQPEGTPLASWPGITRSDVEELKYINIVTVEQLAELADVHATNFMGIQQLKTRAKLFIESAQSNAINEGTAAALEEKDAQIAALQQQVNDMQTALAEVKEANAVSDGGTNNKRRGGGTRSSGSS